MRKPTSGRSKSFFAALFSGLKSPDCKKSLHSALKYCVYVV